jgi:hypothetical protein
MNVVDFTSMTSSGMEGDHSHHGDGGGGNSFCHGEMGMVMYVRAIDLFWKRDTDVPSVVYLSLLLTLVAHPFLCICVCV